jgi:TonB family protein
MKRILVPLMTFCLVSLSAYAVAAVAPKWEYKLFSNAIDGDIYKASKRVTIPEARSIFDLTVSCILNKKTQSITVASFDMEPTRNRYESKPLILSGRQNIPEGRLKLGNGKVFSLGEFFSVDTYNNVITWNILPITESTLFRPYSSLLEIFPMIIEVKNEGGIVQLEIPKEDQGVNAVINKCNYTEQAKVLEVPKQQQEQEQEIVITAPRPTTSHVMGVDDYPTLSYRLREQGTVIITFVVGVDGSVIECKVAKPSGFPRLDEGACALAKNRWRYLPGKQNGKPIAVAEAATISFSLTDQK